MGQIKTKKIRLSNKKISSKIVLISDIHYYNKKSKSKLYKILGLIKKINPNYICIVGDTCDQAKISNEKVLIDWLKKLATITKVIMIYGNHDIACYETQTAYLNKKLFNKIKNIENLILLDNEIKTFDNISFIGLKFDFDYYYKHSEKSELFIEQYNRIVSNLDDKNYNVLLTHSPIAISRKKVIDKLNSYKNIDLVLCGHMHGGLMPDFLRVIFKTEALVSPNKRHLLVKNSYGSFKIENINFVVSSGITKLSQVSRLSIFDRLFNPEIMLLEIEKDGFDNKKKKVLK